MSRTEQRNPKSTHIDQMDTLSMLKLIQEENLRAVEAVGEALEPIARAVDAAADSIARGGRMIYIGCGTSGRLAAQDAAECPPTYGVDYDRVIAVVAGGERALVRASEGAEDSAEMGVRDLMDRQPEARDTVVGISASGNAAYVAAALETAKGIGATTVSVSSNEDCRIAKIADIAVFTDTGAEVITGSTRMKAGTAQKLVLNMISTCAMVKTGKVYENMMINLRPTNIKLRRRMIGIVEEICGVDAAEAERLLEENEFVIRQAVEAHKK